MSAAMDSHPRCRRSVARRYLDGYIRRARRCLAAYVGSARWRLASPETRLELTTDLFADLSLWCDAAGVDFATCLRQGIWHAENLRRAVEYDADPAGIFVSQEEIARGLADALLAPPGTDAL